MKDLLTAVQAVVGGIAITALIYWLLNLLVHRFPEKIKKKIEPYVFIGPVLVLIGIFVVIPTIQSIRLSFMEEEIDGSTTWVGLQNFKDLFAEEYFPSMVVNNLMWIAIVPLLTVSIGLAIAQLANNVGSRAEKILFKSPNVSMSRKKLRRFTSRALPRAAGASTRHWPGSHSSHWQGRR